MVLLYDFNYMLMAALEADKVQWEMSLEIIIYLLGVYFFAGCVKGVVGLGLPTISIALVAVVLGLTEAMTLLIIPSLVTN